MSCGSAAKAAHIELVAPLSEREPGVLQLIANGLANPEIAVRLFLWVRAANARAHNLYGKLGVHSRTQAVATEQGLGVLPSI